MDQRILPVDFRLRAPHQRADARRQLVEMERADEAVVRSLVEERDAVLEGPGARDEDHRQRRLLLAQRRQERVAQHAGQRHGEHRAVVQMRRQGTVHVGAGLDPIRGVTRARQGQVHGTAALTVRLRE